MNIRPRARLSTEEFVRRAKLKHGDTFSYDQTVYTRNEDKVIIICKEHGPFEQRAGSHLEGKKCFKCQNSITAMNKIIRHRQTFVERATTVHRNRYDYNNSIYVNADSPINITCPKHGEFTQRVSHHLNGHGCPSCATTRFRSEKLIFNHLNDRFGSYCTILENIRPIYFPLLNSRLELDIVFVEDAIAIEYNGEHHYDEDHYYNSLKNTTSAKHSVIERDEFKRMWCSENTITLIEIPCWDFSAQQPKHTRDEYLSELSHQIEELICVES